MSKKDAAVKQREQAIKSKSGGAGIAYSMDYPVIITAGVVLPKVYKGKSGMPPTSKPELWQSLVTATTISEKETVGDEKGVRYKRCAGNQQSSILWQLWRKRPSSRDIIAG